MNRRNFLSLVVGGVSARAISPLMPATVATSSRPALTFNDLKYPIEMTPIGWVTSEAWYDADESDDHHGFLKYIAAEKDALVSIQA